MFSLDVCRTWMVDHIAFRGFLSDITSPMGLLMYIRYAKKFTSSKWDNMNINEQLGS